MKNDEKQPANADIRQAAATLGISLTDGEVIEYRKGAKRLWEFLQATVEETDEVKESRNYHEGEDIFDAFRYEFQIKGKEGDLSDLEIAVKDNIAVGGVPMTCGDPLFKYTPPEDSTVVRRLREAGASIVGTTNMDAFALGTTGETCAHADIKNPNVSGHVPGGSSGGSASAVAGGLVDAAIGSDTGGSIRIPASFCGVVGFKPTHRSVSRYGFSDLSPSVDVVGPLADSVETSAEVLEAIVGWDPLDPSTLDMNTPENISVSGGKELDGVTIGLVKEAKFTAEEDVTSAVEDAVETAENAGFEVVDVSINGFTETVRILEGITSPEFATMISRNGQLYGVGTGFSESYRQAVERACIEGKFGPSAREQLVTNLALIKSNGGRTYVAAQNAKRAFSEALRNTLKDVDVLMTPTTPMSAPKFGEYTSRQDMRRIATNTAAFNLSGGPAISLPWETPQNKPVGIQLGGDRHSESLLATISSILTNSK